jgi:chemotaxis protein CheX
MNVKYVNPFVQAAFEVLKTEANLEAQRGALALHVAAGTSEDVTVLISVVGHARGVVLYSMSEKTVLRIVSAILGQEFAEFDSLAQSGVAEIGNVITGRATSLLAEDGCEVRISPPVLILGKGTLVSTLDFQRLVVPLHTEAGDLHIHLAVDDTPESAFSGELPHVAATGVNL